MGFKKNKQMEKKQMEEINTVELNKNMSATTNNGNNANPSNNPAPAKAGEKVVENEALKAILNDPVVKEEIARQEKVLGEKLRETISEELAKNYKDKISGIEVKAQEKITEKIKQLTAENKVELEKQKKFLLEKNADGLINVLDHFIIAVELIDKNPNLANYASGFKMILQMFTTWLDSINVQEIMIKEGDQFNPHTMAAIEKVQSDLPKDAVVKIVRKGYKMFDKVIRFANVITSNNPVGATNNNPTEPVGNPTKPISTGNNKVN